MYTRYSQGWVKHIDFILWDAVSLQAAFLLAFWIRKGSVQLYASWDYRLLAVLFTVTDLVVAAAFNTMHNVMKRGYYLELVQTVKQVLLVFAVTTAMVALYFLIKNKVSKKEAKQ